MSRRVEYNRLPTGQHSESGSRKNILSIAGFAICLAFVGWLFLWPKSEMPFNSKAVVVLKGDSKVEGTVTFEQKVLGGPVHVTGSIKNMDANAQRGFHIHQTGDLSGGCLSAGPHFNPFSRTHGSPEDKNRHVGDLGNIATDKSGVATLDFEDTMISLNGPLSIIGRSVVVHAGTDDLGRGNNDESLKTGNAGGRAACGVIGHS